MCVSTKRSDYDRQQDSIVPDRKAYRYVQYFLVYIHSV